MNEGLTLSLSTFNSPLNLEQITFWHLTILCGMEELFILFIPITDFLIAYIFLHFIYLFLSVLGLRCCSGFSVVEVSGGYSLAVCRLLNVVAPFVAEHGL